MNTSGLKKLCFAIITTVFCHLSFYGQNPAIQKSDLPQKAISFIKKNFSKENIRSVYKESEYFLISKYSVLMDNGTELEFDADGNWTEVNTNNKVPRSIVDTNIKNHLQKSFPGTEIIKISKGRKRIEIDLSNGLELLFDNNGKFIRENN